MNRGLARFALTALGLFVFLVIGRVDPGPALVSDWPVALRWGTYVAIPLLAVACFLLRGLRWRRTPIDSAALAVIAAVLLSGFVNDTPWPLVAMALGVYLRYPLLLMVLANSRLEVSDHLGFTRLFQWLVLAQVPLAIAQFVWSGEPGDHVSGTLGGFGTGGLALMIVCTQTLILSRFLDSSGESFARTKYVLLFIPLVLGTAAAGLVYSIVLAGYLLLREGRLLRVLGTAAIGAVVLLVIILVARAGYVGADLHSIATEGPQRMLGWNAFGYDTEYPMRVGGATRANMMVGIPTYFFRREPARLLLGFGPNAMYNGRAFDAQGHLCQELAAVDGDTMRCASTQLPRTLLELGVVGLFAYTLLLWRVLRLARDRYLGDEDDPRRLSRHAFEGLWLLYAVLATVYMDVWREDYISILVWVLAAGFLAQRRATPGGAAA